MKKNKAQLPIQYNYRQALKHELERRIQCNPLYSLRAFAKDLGLMPGHLSMILREERGLGEKRAKEVAKKLGLTSNEQNHFCLMVTTQDGRSKKSRIMAKDELEDLKHSNHLFNPLGEDVFSLVSNWYDLAILELIKLPCFKNNLNWMSKKLGLSKLQVENGLERLLKANLIQKKGEQFALTHQNNTSTQDVPSKTIRNYHQQSLDKAKLALETQSIQERDFSSLTMAFDPTQMDQIKDEIKRFRRRIDRLTQTCNNLSQIYQFNLQFFRLTQKEEGH